VRLQVTETRLAVCRLAPEESIPEWARGSFVSITRTFAELSIVCDESSVPDGVLAERGWRALQLEGPIPFEVTGVAASLTAPLAAEDISVFLISTYDTDWLLVKEAVLDRAVATLRVAGFGVAFAAGRE
jgi:uncharacterized protein